MSYWFVYSKFVISCQNNNAEEEREKRILGNFLFIDIIITIITYLMIREGFKVLKSYKMLKC